MVELSLLPRNPKNNSHQQASFANYTQSKLKLAQKFPTSTPPLAQNQQSLGRAEKIHTQFTHAAAVAASSKHRQTRLHTYFNIHTYAHTTTAPRMQATCCTHHRNQWS